MSKNNVTIEQLELACRHFHEMVGAGVTENHSIRTLELFCNVYAKIASGGSASPHSVNEVPFNQWSNHALLAYINNPNLRPQGNLIVEHGTPRREFARLVLRLHKEGKLTQPRLKTLVKNKWKLAVVTAEEDARLNKYVRSVRFSTPDKRWAFAGLKFGNSKLITRLEKKLTDLREA